MFFLFVSLFHKVKTTDTLTYWRVQRGTIIGCFINLGYITSVVLLTNQNCVDNLFSVLLFVKHIKLALVVRGGSYKLDRQLIVETDVLNCN